MSNSGTVKQVKSAIRTMELFTIFADAKKPLPLGEISVRMNAPKSSTYELIQTLASLGFLLVLDGGKNYYPSRKLWTLSEQIVQFSPIKEKMQRLLKALRDETGETVVVARLQGTQVHYSDVFDGLRSVRYTANEGDLKDVHTNALGKALVACLDLPDQNQFLSRLTLTRFNENTITTQKELRDTLIEQAEQGVFLSVREDDEDVIGMACSLKIHGHLLAVGIFGPDSRVQKRFSQYTQALKLCIKDMKA